MSASPSSMAATYHVRRFPGKHLSLIRPDIDQHFTLPWRGRSRIPTNCPALIQENHRAAGCRFGNDQHRPLGRRNPPGPPTATPTEPVVSSPATPVPFSSSPPRPRHGTRLRRCPSIPPGAWRRRPSRTGSGAEPAALLNAIRSAARSARATWPPRYPRFSSSKGPGAKTRRAMWAPQTIRDRHP